MPKTVRAVAIDVLAFMLVLAVVFLGLRTYVGYRIGVAQSAIADFQQLIITSPTQQKVDQFLAKYRSYETNGGISLRSPTFPMLATFDNNGYCRFQEPNTVIGGLGLEAMLRLANWLEYSCFKVEITVSKLPNGGVDGFVIYEPVNERRTIIHKTSEAAGCTGRGNPRPYVIQERSYKSEWGVLVGSDTPPEVAASITNMDLRCLRKIKGCSFSELFPAASTRRAADEKEEVKPCR